MTVYSPMLSSEVDISENKEASFLRVLLLSMVVMSPNILTALTVGFPAIAVPQMGLSINDASWFASLSILLSPVGALLIGFTIDSYGRRTALLLGILPSAIGWCLISYYSDVTLLLIAQALIGITFGAVGYPSQVYAGECIMISHVKLRNWYGMSTGIVLSFVVFVLFVLGYYISYLTIAKVATLIALTSFLLVYFLIPESPSWLHHRGRTMHAVKSQEKLGIYQPILKKNVSSGVLPAESSIGSTFLRSKVENFLKKLKRRDVYIPFCSLSITLLLVALSGGMTMTIYLLDILENTFSSEGNSSSAAGYSSVDDSYIYGIVAVGLVLLANLLVSAAAQFLGVKTLNAVANAGAAVGMVLLGYTTIHAGATSYMSSLHVLAVFLVTFMFNFGPLNMTLMIMGDAFPADAKGYASGTSVILTVSAAIMNKLYPYLFGSCGGYLYYGYSVLCAINAVFSYVYLPEIMGKTLDQISEAFLSQR